MTRDLVLHLPCGVAVHTDPAEWIRCFHDPEYLRWLDSVVAEVARSPRMAAPTLPSGVTAERPGQTRHVSPEQGVPAVPTLNKGA